MDNNLTKAYKELISRKMDFNKTINELLEDFYAICRKYDIKEGAPIIHENGEQRGRTTVNPEWVMFKQAFFDHFMDEIDFHFILDECPDDLKL